MDTELQPPAKKLKDEKSMMKCNWKPRPILAEECIRQPALEKSYVGVLKDKRSISKAIAGLASCLPSPQHLKRCSGLRIYLAPVNKANATSEDLKAFLVQKYFDLNLMEDEFEIVEVPAGPPRTKSQMEYASKFWPLNFHPDLHLESLISGSLFNNEQLLSLETCMNLVISAAEDTAIGSSDCNGSALIIDPDEGAILAIAASSMDQHPMWHASMLAVDLVARLQGGGACDLNFKISDRESDITKRKHCEETFLWYPDSLSRLELPKDKSLIFMKKDQKKKKKRENKDLKKEEYEKCGPYLCTGYWAVLLQEPCPLCAMALLHSRVSRIFYGAANLKTGILGSRETLHSVPGLNHRYQVWSGVLEDECVRTLEKCLRIDS